MSILMKNDVDNKPIVIKKPSEKIKSFIKKIEEDKIARRQELLNTKNYTFTTSQFCQLSPAAPGCCA